MYTVIKATGVRKGVNQRWADFNTNEITVANIYEIYRKVYVTLETGYPKVTQYLDMDLVRDRFSLYQDTLHQMVIDIMDASLPTTADKPNIHNRSARFMDAFRAGYSVKTTNSLHGDNAAPADKLDVLLTRQVPVANYKQFYETTLVSINGLYHKTDTDFKSGIIVYKAAESLKISNQNQIGLLTFDGMCTIESIPIKDSMIYKQDQNAPYSQVAYIDAGKDISNKVPLLVIGGYLHFVEDIVTVTGNRSLRIDFSNYPLLDRFYEMRNHVNVSSFNLSQSTTNRTQVAVEELRTDENIKALLLLNQSFIVILDTQDVYIEKSYVRKTGYPGCYIGYTKPNKPLVTGLGRHNEYWYREEDGQYSLIVYDNAVSNRIYNTINPYFENSISDSELPTDPVYLSGAYLLEIGRDI